MRLGLAAVVLAIATAITSFLIFAGYTPIAPTDIVVFALFFVNVLCILMLFGFVVAEAWSLIAARRAQVAGARLHIRIVGLFSIVAIVPAILMAVVGSAILDRSLNPVFLQDVRSYLLQTVDAARIFREDQCSTLLQEAELTASDLDRGQALFTTDRQFFHEFFTQRVKALNFSAAAIMHTNGAIEDKVDTGATAGTTIVHPEANDFQDARNNEPLCMILDEGHTFVALRKLNAFDNMFLYVARPIEPFSVEFPRQAARFVALFDSFDSHRENIQIAFATMYVLVALIMLLSATWVGLSFANGLVAPIRRLIAAADEVASGNLHVQVAVNPSEGDLAHLGETFNKMTSELSVQQSRLIAASNLIDERRLFTEAVLSGVPVAVIGVGPKGQITVVNPSAEQLIPHGEHAGAVGQLIEAVLPEVAPVLGEARSSNGRLARGQIAVSRAGRDRIFNMFVTTEPGARAEKSYVVTLDDITDLVTAQRTAAWADVARRIAHEIKNPLTPIQLSAERLKRKYGRLIAGRPRHLRPMYRHDRAPGRGHQAHGGRVLRLRAHAAGAAHARRPDGLRAPGDFPDARRPSRYRIRGPAAGKPDHGQFRSPPAVASGYQHREERDRGDRRPGGDRARERQDQAVARRDCGRACRDLRRRQWQGISQASTAIVCSNPI